MKKVYILLFFNFIFISCYLPAKSYFNILSADKENGSIKVIVEAKKSGRQSENIFLISQFMNDDDIIVNTSMSQIGPMMFDAGKYEFNIPSPTNSFTKYTNFIEEIKPEKAKIIADRGGFGGSFFTYMMLMNMINSRRPVYYDDYGRRRTINKDYFDDRYSKTPKRNVFNNTSSQRRTLYKPNSRSSARKKSIFRGSSIRRRR
ncbi:hypothetical protein [uncultured Brachyspira sp.]|uniref:hypothetical protein n=1 Tax=uncultured Brachyspira sp. TaxID=221953 RepID=UPI0025E293A9|nr:hypothetical protein [uncultured Brachyspira sp.]